MPSLWPVILALIPEEGLLAVEEGRFDADSKTGVVGPGTKKMSNKSQGERWCHVGVELIQTHGLVEKTHQCCGTSRRAMVDAGRVCGWRTLLDVQRLMSMGCRVLYSEVDHTNARLVFDIFACRVLRIRGGKLGYRCILLLLPDKIQCRGLREIAGERRREGDGYILKHRRR